MNIFVSDGKVLSQDRAFNYGDGIFTTTHVQHGKIQLFDFQDKVHKNGKTTILLLFCYCL